MLRRPFLFTLLAYLATCVALPSGTIYGLPLKLGLMVLLFVLMIPQLRTVYPASVMPVALLVVTICIAGLIGILNGVGLGTFLDQGFAIASLAATIGMAAFAIRVNIISSERLIGFILKIAGLYMLARTAIEVLAIQGKVQMVELTHWVQTIFGASLISLPLPGGLLRLNLTNDWIFLPILIAVWVSVQWSRPMKFLYTALLLFNIYIAYSRLLWLGVVILFLASLIGAVMRSSISKQLSVALPFVLAGGVIAFSFNAFAPAIDIIKSRFVGLEAQQSDFERVIMQRELYNFFGQSPVWGHGLGSHPQYVRFESSPWLYELQWLHLAGQFGVVGTLILVCVLLASLLPAIMRSRTQLRRLLIILLMFWLATGIANCFLITSVSGVIFLMFPLIADANRKAVPIASPIRRRKIVITLKSAN